MSSDLLDRMLGKENWQRREAASLREHSKSPCMPELAEMHEETADALKDARIEIECLRAALREIAELGPPVFYERIARIALGETIDG